MQLFHPQSASTIAARNRLLQNALRPEPLAFAIESEYPLVLAPDCARFSYCLGEVGTPSEEVVAHANLWPRVLIERATGKTFHIGLIGNVATAAAFRGRGLMTQLFDELVKVAQSLDLEALVLWSDLGKFYQKLRFTSLGEELRFEFDWRRLRAFAAGERVTAGTFLPTDPSSLTAGDLQDLIACRHAVVATLERTPVEFAALLKIPNTKLFTSRNRDGMLDGYFIIGKGYDMLTVAHEWGAQSATDLLRGLAGALSTLRWQNLLLLTPAALQPDWQRPMARVASSIARHPMALARLENKNEASTILAKGFIWGLDSI